jgi:hypothetical protein
MAKESFMSPALDAVSSLEDGCLGERGISEERSALAQWEVAG